MSFTTKQQQDFNTILYHKCPKCETGLKYIKGNPDFLGCPNYKNCGFEGINAQGAIMLLRRYISQLPDLSGTKDEGTRSPNS